VRYIVDDEEMKWIDRWEQIVLTGWTAGKHTIRLEPYGYRWFRAGGLDYLLKRREY
jgi:hypothetical protein